MFEAYLATLPLRVIWLTTLFGLLGYTLSKRRYVRSLVIITYYKAKTTSQ